MQIAFNITAAVEGSSGFVHSTELLRAMAPMASRHRLVAITLPEQEKLRHALPDTVEHLVIAGAPQQSLQRTAWLQWRLPTLLQSAGVDLLYNKGNFHLFRSAVRQVCMLENANPFSRLGLRQPLGAHVRNRLLRVMSASALRNAAGIVFPSDNARRGMLAQIPTRAATAVIPYAWRPVACQPVDVSIDSPFILAVSSLYPHRNLPTAVQALGHLHARGTFRGHLVIVGGGSPHYAEWFARHVASSAVAAHVHVLPPMSSGQLATLYSSAAIALMPSLEETFGIPILEAMGYGVPIVASTVRREQAASYFLPFEEIAGEAAEYFEALDASACASAVERALQHDRRRALVEHGRARVAEYTWTNAARLTIEFLESLAPN